MFRFWNIGRIAGIPLRIHATFLLLLGWFGVSSLAYQEPLAAGLHILFPVLLFGIIVLHELGHALMARSFGIATRDITLYPIGGIASLESTPPSPRQEMAIAAAGPAVNLALATMAFALGATVTSPLASYLLDSLVTINLGLALFNLLPALPMDGGRILRAYLSTRMDRVAATNKAASLARTVAWGLGIFGLATASFNLVLIGIFVWFAATAEQGQAIVGRVLHPEPKPEPQQIWLPFPNARRYAPEIIDAEYVEIPLRR